MELGLNGRVAVVCGASSGLGLACAESLAAEGAHVAMVARGRDRLVLEAERARRAADRRRPDRRRGARADRHRDDRALRQDRHPRQQRAEHAARTRPPSSPSSRCAQAVEAFLVSTVDLTNHCLPWLERSEAGRIINLESISVSEPIPWLATSNAVRPGVIGWAKTLADELGPKGITVNSIATGGILTELTRSRLAGGTSRASGPTSRSAGSAGPRRSATSSASSPRPGRAT